MLPDQTASAAAVGFVFHYNDVQGHNQSARYLGFSPPADFASLASRCLTLSQSVSFRQSNKLPPATLVSWLIVEHVGASLSMRVGSPLLENSKSVPPGRTICQRGYFSPFVIKSDGQQDAAAITKRFTNACDNQRSAAAIRVLITQI